ncbi:hypothetical protein OS493_027141 [Desmophyllum pertusum]|uniref:Uncharacterized protein n=1 Tax=Desmophyllum pertusum TaxID=174260 RepID=A0A9W9ZYB5_9CNID|nr:hypothetical protein OS493_027141 [Desmophyllum pertusum]
MTQENEFTTLLNSTSTVEPGELAKQLLSCLEKMDPRLFQMGTILVNSAEFPQLHALMFQSFKRCCLAIYRRNEVKLSDKKAELCSSWLKYLNDFKPGRNTPERKALESISFGNQYSARDVHCLSTLFASYSLRVNTLKRLREEESRGIFAETSSPPAVQREESFDKIYSFAGWSLNSMKNTRTRALAGKGYEVSQSRRKAVEEELSFVDMLCHKNKKEIKNNSTFLRELDVAVGSEKGGLYLPSARDTAILP